MPTKYILTEETLGYFSKQDKTNTDPRFLVSDSQNIIVSDQEKIQTRKGYTIYGVAGSGSDPVDSEASWPTSSDSVLNLRKYSTTLQVYLGTVDGVVVDAWTTISTGITFPSDPLSFAAWWDTGEDLDILLMVGGTDKIWDWSGGVTTLASATSNSLTKNGTGTWAAARFLTNGTTKVVINGTAYTYTGGESTTTLTGVTPDPSGEAANSVVFQEIRESDNEPVDGWVNDFIRVKDNQLWLGSNSRNEIYVSKNTDFKDFAFSTSRLPGEGALLVLDGVGRGFVFLTTDIFIGAGRDDWYQTSFEQLEVNAVLIETLKVKKLKTSPGMAPQSQDLIDGEYFVGFDKILHEIVGVDIEGNLITRDLSDPIKPDFDAATFTNGHLKKHRNRIYIACPEDSNVWINEARDNKRFWQPPQILPIRRFAIIADLIYGHSSGFNETYKLFDGTNDNGNPISFIAAYAYRSYGHRDKLKRFTRWLIEGYIRGNTKITHQLRYDFQGSVQTLEKEIDGADKDLIYETIAGMTPLGTTPLGVQEQATQQPKFRKVNTFAPKDFYEIQSVFYSSDLDAQFEIICQGGDVALSPNKKTKIIK